MMGSKVRALAPLCNLSLEALVPADHFYRHLDAKLELGFVRDLVRDRYKSGGRPSIDRVVFFKLQLVMFFEGIRSKRELVRGAADRLSVRWYLGYDLHEALPDHSSLTRLWKVKAEALLIATGQNLKRLLRKRGWGRRPFPRGAPGLVRPPLRLSG
jgi:transposase